MSSPDSLDDLMGEAMNFEDLDKIIEIIKISNDSFFDLEDIDAEYGIPLKKVLLEIAAHESDYDYFEKKLEDYEPRDDIYIYCFIIFLIYKNEAQELVNLLDFIFQAVLTPNQNFLCFYIIENIKQPDILEALSRENGIKLINQAASQLQKIETEELIDISVDHIKKEILGENKELLSRFTHDMESKIAKIQSSVSQELEENKKHAIVLLGLFTAVISFVVANTQIITKFNFTEALYLLIGLGICLASFYGLIDLMISLKGIKIKIYVLLSVTAILFIFLILTLLFKM